MPNVVRSWTQALLRGAMAGAMWTTAKVHVRDLQPMSRCLYYKKDVPEDEEQVGGLGAFPSGCHAASKRLLLGSLQEWPACLRMCGIVPEGIVEIGGMDHDSDGASGAKSLIECPKTGS